MRKYLEANIEHNTLNMPKETWLKLRKKGIGGSDASSILNLNPYKSSVNVYMEKIDENIEINNNMKMILGEKLEEFVAKEFCNQTGKKVRNLNGILRNHKYPYAIANLDKVVVGENAFLECVVTNSFCKKIWSEEVPINYQIQCYHYMAVTGATHCYVCALIGNEDIKIYKLERDEELIEYIMEKEEEFWKKYILGDDIPLPDGSEDYSKFLKKRYKNIDEKPLNLFIESSKLSRLDTLNYMLSEIKLQKAKIEQEIQSQMKNHEVAYIGDRKITWKWQSRSSIDSKKLKNDYPHIVKDYMKTTETRVFKVN